MAATNPLDVILMLERNNSVFSLNLQVRASLDHGICIGADKLLSVEDEMVKVEASEQQAQPEATT